MMPLSWIIHSLYPSLLMIYMGSWIPLGLGWFLLGGAWWIWIPSSFLVAAVVAHTYYRWMTT